MTTAPEVSLVVDACHLEGRHERLDALVAQLEMCEKALQVTRLDSLLLLDPHISGFPHESRPRHQRPAARGIMSGV